MVAANTFGMRAVGVGTAARLAAEARLADLRQKLREALAQKQIRMKEFVETCKADRRAVRDHVREMRARSLRDLKDQIQAARGAAKLTRLTRLAEVRQVAGDPVQQARGAAAVERAHQVELARLEREERSRRVEIGLAHERSLAAGALRSAIFGKLAPLFERQGRGVAPAPGESRAEALLRYAERNPEKAHAVVEPQVHRKVEDTQRAVAEAERAVRAIGGDVRVGARPSPAEKRDGRERQERAAAQGAWPLPGQQRIGPVAKTTVGRRPSNDTRLEPLDARAARVAAPLLTGEIARGEVAAVRSLGDLARAGAEASPAAAGGIADNVRTAIARDAGDGGKGPTKGSRLGKSKVAKPSKAKTPKRPKPTKTPEPKVVKQHVKGERKKGQVPRSGPGLSLSALIQERDEIAEAKSMKGKGARAGRGKRAPAKKGAAKTSTSVAPVPPTQSYAAWCERVSQAAAKHGRRIAFGVETHDAWRAGTNAEAFVLTQPHATPASPAAIVRDGRGSRPTGGDARAPVAKGNAPSGSAPESASQGPALVISTIADSVRPYKVRASCGHVVVRPMRAATARVPYSPGVLLDAPKGRACDACEAKKKPPVAAPSPKPDFGVHAPNLAPKRDDVKAPELKDTAEIAKRIRADIADAVRTRKLPKGTYSVRTDKYSLGSSINVVASKLPFTLLNPAAFHLVKGSSDVEFDRDRFRSRYTPEAESALTTLDAIVGAYHWDRSDPVTDYYNERFGRDVKLDTSKEWERINEAKRAEARAPSPPSPLSSPTPASPSAGRSALPSPLRVVASKLKATAVRPRAGRSKGQQTLDTDSPLFAGAPRFAPAPPRSTTTAEGPTTTEGGGNEP